MATVRHILLPQDFIPRASNGGRFKVVDGTNFPVASIAFSTSTTERVYAKLRAVGYGSGNLTLNLVWYADTASSGDVVWDAAIAAITPNTDSQDVETKAFATANTVTDSHLGTTGQRVHECAITISNLDSIAAGDEVWMYIERDVTDAADTMSGDALLISAELTYSDT